ncbi:hypothetical protein Micbo1qcDRAFT_230439 [Microdochium bolleyi]|uniref:Uncharacterized protein n=1 Tax=Microdochium bolleyi TaxID=196109 RepID=A0A136JD99_9PEZI|nr:hypothetical protein Micbo1qcDRAFT_230439 [Microdochium bolleyi]
MDIHPPLLNSANPWATTLSDLRELWECPHTGAVTTRTALLEGFPHDSEKHRFCLFDAHGFRNASESSDRERIDVVRNEAPGIRMNASLNTLGYSYYTLDEYLGFIIEVISTADEAQIKKRQQPKWFIVSVTGTPADVAECYRRISALQNDMGVMFGKGETPPVVKLAMEVNLSCPNIPDKPPPAYSEEALQEYIAAVGAVTTELESSILSTSSTCAAVVRVPWGVKTPPYTFAGQFEQLMSALRVDTLPGMGIGGMAGAPLHPLALGNVATLRRLLDEHASTRHNGKYCCREDVTLRHALPAVAWPLTVAFSTIIPALTSTTSMTTSIGDYIHVCRSLLSGG